jgi:hypothetical protein
MPGGINIVATVVGSLNMDSIYNVQITGSDWATNKTLIEGTLKAPFSPEWVDDMINHKNTIQRTSTGFLYYGQDYKTNTTLSIPRIQNLYNNSKYQNVVDTEFTYFIPPSTLADIAETFSPPPDGTFITYPNGRVDDNMKIIYFMYAGEKRYIPDWQTVQVMLRERNLQYSSVQVLEVMEIGLIEDGRHFPTRANEWTQYHPEETGYNQLAPNDPGEQDIVEHLRVKWENKMVTIDWGNDQGIWANVPQIMKTNEAAGNTWKWKYAEPMSPILKDNLTKTVVENKLSPGMRTRLHKDTFIMINGKYRSLPYNENTFVFNKEITTTSDGVAGPVEWFDNAVAVGDYFWWFYYVSRNYEDHNAEARFDGTATPNGLPPQPWPSYPGNSLGHVAPWTETNPHERLFVGQGNQGGAGTWKGGVLNPNGYPEPQNGAIAVEYLGPGSSQLPAGTGVPLWYDGYGIIGNLSGNSRTGFNNPYQGAKIFDKNGVFKGWWDATSGCGYYGPGKGTSIVTVTNEDNNILLQTAATFKTFYDIYQLYSNYNGFTHLATPFDETQTDDPENRWSHYKGGHPPSTYLMEGKGINPEGAPGTPNPSATSFDGFKMPDDTSGVMNQSLYWDPNISQILGTSIQLLPKKQLHPNTVLWTYGQDIYDQLFRNPIYADDGTIIGYEEYEPLTLEEYQIYLNGGDPLAKEELQPYFPQGNEAYYPTWDAIQVEWGDNYAEWVQDQQYSGVTRTEQGYKDLFENLVNTTTDNSNNVYESKSDHSTRQYQARLDNHDQYYILPGRWKLPITDSGTNIPTPKYDSVKRERAFHEQGVSDAIALSQTDTSVYYGQDGTPGGSAYSPGQFGAEFDGPPLVVGNVGNYFVPGSGYRQLSNVDNNLPVYLQDGKDGIIHSIHGVMGPGDKTFESDSDDEILAKGP